jgi:hypothetical protein
MGKPTKEEIRKIMRYLGSRTSEAKTIAVRKNGRLGGRPKIGVGEIC